MDPLPAHYGSISELMSTAGLGMSPAEAHGIASGIVMARTEAPDAAWEVAIGEVLVGEGEAIDGCRRLFSALFDTVTADLDGADLEWQPLLPDDEAQLATRCGALRDWCAGFLFGIGAAGERLRAAQQDVDVKDALADIGEITRLDADVGDDGEAAEADFMQLTEYVRVAACLIGEHLRTPDPGEAP